MKTTVLHEYDTTVTLTYFTSELATLVSWPLLPENNSILILHNSTRQYATNSQ
jgi:hypothetical protein